MVVVNAAVPVGDLARRVSVFAVRRNNPGGSLASSPVSGRGAQPDTAGFCTLVDATRFADQDGTSVGICNRVSFRHRAW